MTIAGSAQPDPNAQETYAAVDPKVLAAKKQKKAKAKKAKKEHEPPKSLPLNTSNQRSAPDEIEEVYQVCGFNSFKVTVLIISIAHGLHNIQSYCTIIN